MNLELSPFKVIPGSFNKVLSCPSSKSQANRLLILAALDTKDIFIKNISSSTDVETMLSCFEKIGLKIEKEGDGVWIRGSFPACEKSEGILLLSTGDGGTTNRFLIPLLSLGKRLYQIEAKGHMRNRPMDPLVNSLRQAGVTISMGEDYWLKVKGPWKKNEGSLEVESSSSTQFATGILLASAATKISVVPKNITSSLKYFQMSEDLIKKWREDKLDYTVPVDFSSLSYPLALAATLGEVTISNFSHIDPFQPDSIFIDILKKMGCLVENLTEGLRVQKIGELKSIELDCSGFPDLVPTLAYVCSYAQGASHLRNLEVLRHKESDRIVEIIKVLQLFKINYSFDESASTLIIHGNSSLKSEFVSYHPPADHRIIMMTYMFMRKNGGGEIFNQKHVNKSYPDFFEKMQ